MPKTGSWGAYGSGWAGSAGGGQPCNDQNFLNTIETGGCFADGIRAATGATVGHRTLRIEDLEKSLPPSLI